MPILPKAISKKLLNATEKVKNYVESWDLDESPKSNAPADLNSSFAPKNSTSTTRNERYSINFVPPVCQINVSSIPQVTNDSTSLNSIASDLTHSTDDFLTNEQSLAVSTTSLVQNFNAVPSPFSKNTLKSPTPSDGTVSVNNDANSNMVHNTNPPILTDKSAKQNSLNDVTSHNSDFESCEQWTPSFPTLSVYSLPDTPNGCILTTTSSIKFNPDGNSCRSVWSSPTPITSVASTSFLQELYFQNNTSNFHVEQFKTSGTSEKIDNRQQSSILDSNISCFVSQSNNSNIFEKTKEESMVIDGLSNSCEISNNLNPNLIVNDLPSNTSIVNLNAESSITSNGLQPNSATQLGIKNFLPVNVSNHSTNFKSHTRQWCIFCENNTHFSHSCQKFRSKEQYWEQVLTERRCKNCFRFYHKSADCYNRSFCKNISCHRKDKHSPVLCESNYFYFDYSQSKSYPCHNFFSQITDKKPPPLMSLDLSHIQHNFTKGMYRPRGISSKVKRSVSVSTQTSEHLVVPENCISFKSQFSQTDNPKEDISFSQCSSPTVVLNSKQEAKISTPVKSIVETGETPAESFLSTCNLDKILFLNKPQSQSTLIQPPKVKVSKCNENPNIVLPPVSMSFSEIISHKGPSAGTTKTINGFEINFPPPVWENASYPEHMRALEFLRAKSLQSGNIDESDIEIVASAIKCLKKFIEKAEPKTALLYMSQLKCTLKSLRIENIQF